MKNILYKFSIIFLIGLIASCDLNDKLEELNIDEKNPSEVPGEPLFTNGVRNMFDLMLGTSVNSNVFRLYSQYWAQTTYPDESQYNQVTRTIPDNMWLILYRDVLKDLDGAKTIISAEVTLTDEALALKNNKLACIKIAEAFTYSTLVDIFGDVPFTDALDEENSSPMYDDAATIYSSVLDSIDNAIALVDEDYEGLTDYDPIYEGDMSLWLKAANSLKLRMAMRLADTNATKAKTTAEAAAANLIESNDDNFTITYTSSSPNTHPLYVDLVESGRNDFIPASTIVDVMNRIADPRMFKYFELYSFSYDKDDDGKWLETTLEGTGGFYQVFQDMDGNDSIVYATYPYVAAVADSVEFDYFYGGVYGSANAASGFSQIGDMFKNPALPGTLMSYAEVEFLLAEAAERGYNVGGSAEEHYNAGIEASMNEYGISDDEAISAYLESEGVAYTTATGNWKQKIGTQKWLAMYNIPFEGWTAYRLLDFTDILYAPEDMTLEDIPTRFIYPIEEATLNGASYQAAAQAIGGDKATTKLFWDIQ